MKKNSIVLKLFVITTIFFSCFLIIALISQSLFFEKFYIHKKVDRIQESLDSFTRGYAKEGWNEKKLSEEIREFMDNNNSLIAILDNNGVVKHMNTFEMMIMTEEGKEITIPLNNIAYSESFEKLDLAVGKHVDVEGIYLNNTQDILGLYGIVSGDNKWEAFRAPLTESISQPAVIEDIKFMEIQTANDISIPTEPTHTYKSALQFKEKAEIRVFEFDKDNITPNNFVIDFKPTSVTIKFIKLSGEIKRINIPQKTDLLVPYKTNMFHSAIDKWFWVSKSEDIQSNESKLVTYKYKDTLNGTENMVFVRPIIKDGKVNETVFVMTSLQPVDEAITVMKDYYVYVFAGAILLIILLSLIFSKLIARPLIKMNNVAMKMANMDFSEQLEISSDDEIGSLSGSINLLSRNLSENIEKLSIANEQLKKDIEKERRLEEMRKEFISSASHELKTPISIIKSFAEGIKDNLSQNKVDYYIDVILDESDKMKDLVMDMLELSKLESGGYKLNLEAFDIVTLIQDICSKFSPNIKDKGIHLIYKMDEQEMKVFGDIKQIKQVVINILSNSIKYTFDHGHIYLSVNRLNDHIKVTIENEGDPINENKISKIWDRFYRIEASRNKKLGGTGLGLSIVKNILELHGSKFGVKNTDRGVEFNFMLQSAAKAVDFFPS